MTANVTNLAAIGPSVTANSGGGSLTKAPNSLTSNLLSSMNELPNDLFTNKDIFLELFSGCDSVWNQLNETKRQELVNNYLPKELSNDERLKTIELLMNGSLNRFNFDSLSEAFICLKLHKLSPDLVKALEDVKSLKKKLFDIYEQKRQSVLLNDVILKRKQIFNQSIQTNIVSNKSFDSKKSEKTSLISETMKDRIRRRYRKELEDISINSEASSGEEVSKTARDNNCNSTQDNGLQLNPMSDKQYYQMLRKHRRKRKAKESDNRYDPTLETESITLSDIIMRVTNSAVTTAPAFSCLNDHKSYTSSQSLTNNSVKSSSTSTPKKKAKQSNVTKSIQSNQTTVVPKPDSVVKIKEELIENKVSVKSESNSKTNVCEIKEESNEKTNGSTNKQMISKIKITCSVPQVSESELKSPIIAAPLPAIPVLMSPSVSVSSEPSPVSVAPTVQMESPPKCFFSLLRDIFMANATTDRRLSLHKLEELVKEKLRNFSPFIGWSSEMVASAMNYLSGVLPPPYLVPLVDYKEKNQQWQWIGGGRDRDQQLAPLCEQWMKNKDEDPTASLITFSQALPPPAKCLTDWVVRPSSDEEKEVYRKQEAIRYQNPYKAFTYRVHGYESVVGPVKGCGIGAANGHNSSSPNKAREHSLLVSDRPPFVTLLSLVRDAAARLPNGEGTRADICELLKDSQYLLPTISDQQVNGIVSGALDRLHYEKDPCVKYDVNRKVWIYLHRNRTEAEFERLHEVQIAAAKAKRSMSKASRKTNCVGTVGTTQNSPLPQTTGQMSIISKTTQQAIHQAVNNILNSEALKISKSPTDPSVSVDSSENPAISSSKELFGSKSELSSDLRVLVNKPNKEKQLTSFESFNGSTGTTLSPNSLFVSLQTNNHMTCKSEATSAQLQTLDKKKSLKLRENKSFESENSYNLIQKKKVIIDSSSDSTVIHPNHQNINISLNSSDLTKFIANESNSVKSLPKSRNIKQTKPSIKVQIPKTLTLPLSISQNSLKSQPSITTIASENLPALISVTNASNKTICSTAAAQPSKSFTKIISGTQINSTTTGTTTATNQMHQISIPTSVLFGARPGSVVLGLLRYLIFA